MSPSSREAMDRFKMLIRSANLWGGYNASLTSCKTGSIGSLMVDNTCSVKCIRAITI